MKKTVILKKQDIGESIQRIAKEIVENNEPMEDVVLVGIRTGGEFLAARLKEAGFEDHVTIEERRAA